MKVFVVKRRKELGRALVLASDIVDTIRPDKIEGLATNEAHDALKISIRFDEQECHHLCFPT